MTTNLHVVRDPLQVSDGALVAVLNAGHGAVAHDGRLQGVGVLKPRLVGAKVMMIIIRRTITLVGFEICRYLSTIS